MRELDDYDVGMYRDMVESLELGDGMCHVSLAHLYADGAQYTLRAASHPDTPWVFTWTRVDQIKDLQARHLITVMSKLLLCKCGCGGRCTIEAILRVIAWSFSCWRRGVWPEVPKRCFF